MTEDQKTAKQFFRLLADYLKKEGQCCAFRVAQANKTARKKICHAAILANVPFFFLCPNQKSHISSSICLLCCTFSGDVGLLFKLIFKLLLFFFFFCIVQICIFSESSEAGPAQSEQTPQRLYLVLLMTVGPDRNHRVWGGVYVLCINSKSSDVF